MPQTDTPPAPLGPKGPNLNEFFDAALGWQASFLRTIMHGVIRPEAIARAALAGGSEAYASPLRMLVFMMGVLMAVTTFVTNGAINGVENYVNAAPDALDTWLQETHALTLAEVNDTWTGWFGLMIWPIMIISSSPYVLLFKLFDPKRTTYGAALVYIVTTNAMLAPQAILQVVLAMFVPLDANMLISTVVSFVLYYYVAGRVVFTLYAKTVLGGAFKTLAVIALTPVTLVLTAILQLVALGMVLHFAFDLALFDLFE